MLERSATDVFGLGIPNSKLIADRIAEATSFPVYVPDLLQGELILLIVIAQN